MVEIKRQKFTIRLPNKEVAGKFYRSEFEYCYFWLVRMWRTVGDDAAYFREKLEYARFVHMYDWLEDKANETTIGDVNVHSGLYARNA